MDVSVSIIAEPWGTRAPNMDKPGATEAHTLVLNIGGAGPERRCRPVHRGRVHQYAVEVQQQHLFAETFV